MNAKLGACVVIVAACACGERGREMPAGGSTIHVLFDERHGLEGGELVRLHEFDIGAVASVDLARGRVSANISLSPEARANLTTATTFTVEEDDTGRYLETHVLDPDAPPLDDGAAVEGADGSLELMAMRARAAAGELASSEWWGRAGEFVDGLEKDFDDVDWKEEEEELRQKWEKAIEEMDDAVGERREELGKRVDELARELDEMGRSDEARKLRERFEKLLDELGNGS